MNKKLSTKKFISLIKENPNKVFEAALDNGYYCATHFLFLDNKFINDTGIDSKVTLWKAENFLQHYKNAFWQIDQIVNIG